MWFHYTSLKWNVDPHSLTPSVPRILGFSLLSLPFLRALLLLFFVAVAFSRHWVTDAAAVLLHHLLKE